MKKGLLAFIAVFVMAIAVRAAEPNVLGTWLVGDKDYKIKVTKNSKGELEGHVVWLKEPNDANGKPKTDIVNPDPAKRNVPVKGLKILWGFKWNAETGYYEGGKVYKEGKTYCGKLNLNEDGTLNLKGFLCSAKFLGKKDTWTRVSE